MHIPLNVLYYCLQVYMASSILHVTKLSFNNGNEPCKVRMLYGFHIRDIYARINEVYVYDCVMICKLLEQCLSASYVSTSRSSTACFLSKTVSTNIQALYRLPGSFYFEFTCSNGEKTKRLPTALDHGPKYSGCGVKAFKSIGQTRFNRIVGGTFAPPYSQPWLGQVMKHSWNLCGISLVSGIKTDSTVWAISAAHCFKRRYDFDHSINLESYNFIFGVHDLRYHSPHMKLRKAEQIILHPDYDFETNDLAIIKFEKPIPFNDYVRPLCMAWKKLRTYKGPCMVCGYGAVNYATMYSNIPKCFATKVHVDSDTIRKVHESDVDGSSYSPSSEHKFKGAYKGDSGGPVSCPVDDLETLYGIIYGTFVADSRGRSLSLYVYIPLYVKWINRVMTNKWKAKMNDDRERGNGNRICFPNIFSKGCLG